MRSTRALIGCGLAGWLLVGACRGSDSEPGAPGSSSAAVLPAPEKPALLVGVGSLAPARDFWPALREALHVRDPSLPRSWGAALSVVAGLPITTAELFEDDRPSKLALSKSETGTPELVLAVPVRAVDRLLVVASSGRDALFDRVSVERVELLRLRHGSDERRLSLGVSGNHLLLSTSEHALRQLGAWLAHGSVRGPELGATELLRLELPSDLDLGPHLARATSLLGLPGDFVVGAVPSTGEVLGSARPTLAVSAHALGWTFALAGAEHEPRADAVPSAVAEALLELPSELSVAIVAHTDEAARIEQARQARSALEALARARGLDPFTDLDALERLAEARGAIGWVGFEQSPVGALAYGKLELRDADAASAALDALFGVRPGRNGVRSCTARPHPRAVDAWRAQTAHASPKDGARARG
jgi:hypothetical protein